MKLFLPVSARFRLFPRWLISLTLGLLVSPVRGALLPFTAPSVPPAPANPALLVGAPKQVACLSLAYVTPAGAGAKNGSSWANAFPGTSLQTAIDNTCPGGQVWVANGVYKPTTTTDRTISFAMKNGVAIYGGFVGTESNLSQRPALNPSSPVSSTLSGDIGVAGNTSDNSYHIISNSPGLTNSALLDGFVLTGGNANGASPQNSGGAIYNDGTGSGRVCSPTLRNCFFQGNSASLEELSLTMVVWAIVVRR